MRNRALGLDLGQVSDYTALALVEWSPNAATGLNDYALRHLERVPLGTSYPDIARHVARLMTSEPLKDRTKLVVDGTGVGRPGVDLLKQEGLTDLLAVVVHGGNETTTDQNHYRRVPKRMLVNTAQVLLQARRLRIPKALPLAKTLEEELLKFEVKISDAGNDSYGAWREGAHDDLVFALCLALWYGERVAAADQYVREHPTGRIEQRVGAPSHASLIPKATLETLPDGRVQIVRR
jgi:hypothetical protein